MSSWVIISSWATRGCASSSWPLSRIVFQVRRHATGHGRKRGHHSAKLVGGLTQPRRIPLTQGVLNRREMIRQASPKRLTNLIQDGGVAAAGSQQDRRVEQARSRFVGVRLSVRHPVNRRPQVGSLDRLGQEVVHARRQALARGLPSASAPSRR